MICTGDEESDQTKSIEVEETKSIDYRKDVNIDRSHHSKFDQLDNSSMNNSDKSMDQMSELMRSMSPVDLKMQNGNLSLNDERKENFKRLFTL